MTDVICTVSNCEYHTEDNGCKAKKILITIGGNTDEDVFTPAQITADTVCQTFEKKE